MAGSSSNIADLWTANTGKEMALIIYIYSRKNKEESALMKEDSFIRGAMIVTSVSLLLEIFGQLYISVLTGLGYIFYSTE